MLGRKAYPRARSLFAWKVHLQALADRLGMAVTVCHYPPGTSKWNKVEHRLFSFISMNWCGRPLLSSKCIACACPLC